MSCLYAVRDRYCKLGQCAAHPSEVSRYGASTEKRDRTLSLANEKRKENND